MHPRPSFQAGKDRLTFALPSAASAGTADASTSLTSIAVLASGAVTSSRTILPKGG